MGTVLARWVVRVRRAHKRKVFPNTRAVLATAGPRRPRRLEDLQTPRTPRTSFWKFGTRVIRS